MLDPTADELAAIAAAYAVVTRRHDATAARARPTRWGQAGRNPPDDMQTARFVARSSSGWRAAGRVDG
jgi:hypothetical protein